MRLFENVLQGPHLPIATVFPLPHVPSVIQGGPRLLEPPDPALQGPRRDGQGRAGACCTRTGRRARADRSAPLAVRLAAVRGALPRRRGPHDPRAPAPASARGPHVHRLRAAAAQRGRQGGAPGQARLGRVRVRGLRARLRGQGGPPPALGRAR